MSDDMFHWKPQTVKATDPSFPIRYAGSDHLDRVRPGDTLWVVTSPGRNELTLVARIPVTQVTSSRTEVERQFGRSDIWSAK
jgi:hypothetical protein